MLTHISSRDFNQDISRAKKASKTNPVIITERGVPAHVLLSYQQYEDLVKQQPSMAQMLACEDIEFSLEKIDIKPMPADLD